MLTSFWVVSSQGIRSSLVCIDLHVNKKCLIFALKWDHGCFGCCYYKKTNVVNITESICSKLGFWFLINFDLQKSKQVWVIRYTYVVGMLGHSIYVSI